MAKFTAEQQAAIDSLTSEQQVAIQNARALLAAEAALIADKGDSGVESEALRDAKLLLRTQRQAYRERYRSTVLSFSQRYSLNVTKDGFEPLENPPVAVHG